ncbi:MAG: DUF3592 domain-containing protein [Acidimicrobiales bacterium]
MVERRSTPTLPLIVTLTILVAGLSTAFWQWEMGQTRLTAETVGTVQSVEYVRQGASASVPFAAVTYSAGADAYVLTYHATSQPNLAVGDELNLRFNPNEPAEAAPAAVVASDVSRHRSFAIFSALVGAIAVLAALATRLEAQSRDAAPAQSAATIAAR